MVGKRQLLREHTAHGVPALWDGLGKGFEGGFRVFSSAMNQWVTHNHIYKNAAE